MDPLDIRTSHLWCKNILQQVSRTFALNIRLLSGDLRIAVQQAYLLCRIADTIEDDDAGVVERKSACLHDFGQLMHLSVSCVDDVRRWQQTYLPSQLPRTPEWQLCRNADRVFQVSRALPRSMQVPIGTCVRDMSLGMSDVVARMRLGGHRELQIESMQDLESYCHIVAGTVGAMLCDLFLAFQPNLPHEQKTRMRSLAERFGLALQLVNILQDVRIDRRRRVHYIPRQLMSQQGTSAEVLLDPESRVAWVGVLSQLVTAALSACDAALEFSLLLPRRQARLRLFCLWPLFLALRTLDAVLAGVPSASQERPRVPRRQVRRCLLRASIRVYSDRGLRSLYASERARVVDRLASLGQQAGFSTVTVGRLPGEGVVGVTSDNIPERSISN